MEQNPLSERDVLESEFYNFIRQLPFNKKQAALSLLTEKKSEAIKATKISKKPLGFAVVEAIRETLELLKQGDKSQ